MLSVVGYPNTQLVWLTVSALVAGTVELLLSDPLGGATIRSDNRKVG